MELNLHNMIALGCRWYQPTEPMRNEYPHITIGMAPRVNPVVSNELLARRAATEDLQTGLQAKALDDRSRR